MSERKFEQSPERRKGLQTEADAMECDYKSGTLPRCAPLAISFTPMQQSVTPQYGKADALSRGTLFPGLDLPFMNIVNKTDHTNTPLGELMALGFVIHELNLYLDTHPSDKEALEMMTKYITLYNEGLAKYVKLYGPVTVSDVTSDSFSWIDNPWPWELTERTEY